MKKRTIFKLFDAVIILPYKNDKFNKHGIIRAIDPEKGYHVSNFNMPYLGTVCGWFKNEELKKVII